MRQKPAWRCLLAAAILSFAAGLAKAQDWLSRGLECLPSAQTAWNEARLEEAAGIFRQAWKADPENRAAGYWLAVTWIHVALCDFCRGQSAAAAGEAGWQELQQASRADPYHPEMQALLALGLVLRIQQGQLLEPGQLSETADHRAQALATAPDNPRVHCLAGASYWLAPKTPSSQARARWHLQRAEVLYEREARIPDDPQEPGWGRSLCLALLGDVFFEDQDYVAAYRYYQKSLMAGPRDPIAERGLERLSRASSR